MFLCLLWRCFHKWGVGVILLRLSGCWKMVPRVEFWKTSAKDQRGHWPSQQGRASSQESVSGREPGHILAVQAEGNAGVSLCCAGKQNLDVTLLLWGKENEDSLSQDSDLSEGFRLTRGKKGQDGIEEGRCFSQWVTGVPNLPYALHLWIGTWRHCLVPNPHQALKQHGCSAVTKWPWDISSSVWGKKSPTSSTAPSMDVQCSLAPVWDISWELTQEGDYLLLYDFTAFRSHQVLLERLTST